MKDKANRYFEFEEINSQKLIMISKWNLLS